MRKIYRGTSFHHSGTSSCCSCPTEGRRPAVEPISGQFADLHRGTTSSTYISTRSGSGDCAGPDLYRQRRTKRHEPSFLTSDLTVLTFAALAKTIPNNFGLGGVA